MPQKEKQKRTFYQDVVLLTGLALSIYIVYGIYGLLQEKIFSNEYERLGSLQKDKFKQAFALVLFPNILGWFIGVLINKIVLRKKTNPLPELDGLKMGFYNSCSMILSNTALTLVSYPVQALIKSSKILSIMLVGIIIGHKRFTKSQYGCALTITLAIFLFNYLESSGKKSKSTQIQGLLMLFISLFTDGMLNDLQNDSFGKVKNLDSFDLLEKSSGYVSLICLIYGLVTGQVMTFYTFVIEHPSIISDILIISLCSTIGMVIIYYTISQFGNLALGFVTTTRKIFTVIFSIVIFKHKINNFQYACIGAVFLVIFYEFYEKYEKSQHQKKKKVHEYESVNTKQNSVRQEK